MWVGGSVGGLVDGWQSGCIIMDCRQCVCGHERMDRRINENLDGRVDDRMRGSVDK